MHLVIFVTYPLPDRLLEKITSFIKLQKHRQIYFFYFFHSVCLFKSSICVFVEANVYCFKNTHNVAVSVNTDFYSRVKFSRTFIVILTQFFR